MHNNYTSLCMRTSRTLIIIPFVVYIGVRFVSHFSDQVFHEYMEKLIITLGHDTHILVSECHFNADKDWEKQLLMQKIIDLFNSSTFEMPCQRKTFSDSTLEEENSIFINLLDRRISSNLMVNFSYLFKSISSQFTDLPKYHRTYLIS